MSEGNERLYEAVQRRLREATTLYEASQACLSISDQKGLLTAVIEAAARATDAAVGSVMLIEEKKGEYVFGAHYGLCQGTIAAIEAELHIPLGEGLIGAVVTTGQPLVVADVSTDPRWIPMETEEPMHSFLGVPLVGREGQPLGALTLSRPEAGAFDEDHARLLSTFANQAAMAIENAQLYEQAQQEITERKRAIEALRESEERYRRLVELSFDAVAIHREGKLVYINAAGAELLGALSPEELVGKPILDFVHPDYLEMAEVRVRQATEGKVAPLTEEKLVRLDGASVDAEVVEIPITYQGQPAVQVVARDITERKRAEEALRRSELQYRTTLDSMGDAIHVVDADLQFVLFNSVFKQWNKELGLEIDVLGRTIFEVFPFLPDGVRDEYQQVFDTGKILITEENTQVGGQEFITETRKIPIFERGRAARVVTVIRDITERKRAEEALKESEEKFRNLAEQSPNMIFINKKGRVVYANKKCEEIMGYKREEFCSPDFDFLTLIAPESIDLIKASFSRHMGGEEVPLYEYTIITKEGKRIEAIITSKLIRYEGESTILGIVTDITERKQLEEQLRQAQKMEAIGTLAGGIAHDFNNILTGILGFASIVHSELPAHSPLRPDVETIILSAQRASELTRQLLTFARRGRVEVRPLSLNDIAREVIRLLERTIDKAIAVEPYLACDLAIVEGDASQLHQMLLNLCLNAHDAMPQGGRLIIETQNVALSEEKARTGLDLQAGRYVLLSVTDTGIGMDAEVQQRLFEPFFTTKEQGRGLGLAMVYGIVRGHGGAVHVYSELGQGSTFKVYLPVVSRLAEDTAPEETEFVGGSETVLVVDDEETVRELLRRILEQGGYTVLLVADGVEAVELYTMLSTKIDLVVLDIIMPQMGGRETYQRLQEINPGVKVLLSSGYSENGQAQDILAAGARGFLQKPYDLYAVLRKVREVLDG